jgi:hypothetical protein
VAPLLHAGSRQLELSVHAEVSPATDQWASAAVPHWEQPVLIQEQ